MNRAGPPGQKNESAPAKKRSHKWISPNSLQRRECQRRSVFWETPLAKWVRQQRINQGHIALARTICAHRKEWAK